MISVFKKDYKSLAEWEADTEMAADDQDPVLEITDDPRDAIVEWRNVYPEKEKV